MNEIHGKSILVRVSESSSYRDSTVATKPAQQRVTNPIASSLYRGPLCHTLSNALLISSVHHSKLLSLFKRIIVSMHQVNELIYC